MRPRAGRSPSIEFDGEIHENSVRTNTSYDFFFQKKWRKIRYKMLEVLVLTLPKV